MLKLLSRLTGALTGENRQERRDARRIYAKIMQQARNPVFYSETLVADDTDGRMEWLSAHLAVVTYTLSWKHEADGVVLSQAIYDVMVDDFDIALREEGLTDSGVKRRVKPLAKMYLTRARTYATALYEGTPDLTTIISKNVLQERENANAAILADYIAGFSKRFDDLTLDQIAATQFDFPEFQVSGKRLKDGK